ncbi:hypothetical protein GCM10018965_066520 [Nonomuraea roseola]
MAPWPRSPVLGLSGVHSKFPGWFLIDGHHKLAAYLKRQLPPACVAIERLPPHGVHREALPPWWPSLRAIWEE